MTEEEAKTKWCPSVRVSGVGTFDNGEWSTNRDDAVKQENLCCIGSACMAWRWHGPEDAGPNEDYVLAKDHPSADPSFIGGQRKLRFPSGYCGLAGKP